MVISSELDRDVNICIFMASLVKISVVPIRFLRTVNSMVNYWVTVSSSDGRGAVNFHRTWGWSSFIEALSSRFQSASHISMGLSISSVSTQSLS